MNSYYTREELSVNTFCIQLYSFLYPLDRTGVRFFFLIIIDSDEKHAANSHIACLHIACLYTASLYAACLFCGQGFCVTVTILRHSKNHEHACRHVLGGTSALCLFHVLQCREVFFTGADLDDM